MPIRVAELPPLTLALTLACAAVSAAAALGKCSATDLALSWPLVARGQLWRLLTPFAYVDGLSMRFMAHLYFFSHFSAVLESGYYAGRTPAYALTLLGGLGAMLVGCLVAPDLEQPFLMTPLAFFVMHLWSSTEPEEPVEIFGSLKTTGAMLPYWLLAALVAATGSAGAMPAMLGIGASVFVDCFRDEVPVSTASAAAVSAASTDAQAVQADGAKPRAEAPKRWLLLGVLALAIGAWQLQRGAAGGGAAGSKHGAQCAQLRWALEIDEPLNTSAAVGPADANASDPLAELLARALSFAPLAPPPSPAGSGDAGDVNGTGSAGAEGATDEASAPAGVDESSASWGPRQIFALFEELSSIWRSKQKARSSKPALSAGAAAAGGGGSAGSALGRQARGEGSGEDDERPAAEAVDELLATLQAQLVDTLAQFDVPDT